MEESTQPEERILAAISHASILMPTTGIAVPVIIWAVQKDKSPYLRFQALQAAAYHMAVMLLWMVGGFLYALSFIGMFVGMMAGAALPKDAAMIVVGVSSLLPFVAILVLLLVGFGATLYGLLGALLTGLGRPFQYPLLGSWLAQTMESQPVDASAS